MPIRRIVITTFLCLIVSGAVYFLISNFTNKQGIQNINFSNKTACPDFWNINTLESNGYLQNNIGAISTATQKITTLLFLEKIVMRHTPWKHVTVLSDEDTVQSISEGYILFDGRMRNSTHRINSKNQLANKIVVMISGLARSKHEILTVITDPQLDTLYLDGCLTWADPKEEVLTDNTKKWKITGADNRGRKKIIQVDAGIKIEIIEPKKVKKYIEIFPRYEEFQKTKYPDEKKIELKVLKLSENKNVKTESIEKTRVFAWGKNRHSELGNGLRSGINGASWDIATAWSTEIEKVINGNIQLIDIKEQCLLRSDKTVWCWGEGDSHDLRDIPRPIHRIGSLPLIESLVGGQCGLTKDEEKWCWGNHEYQAPKRIEKNKHSDLEEYKYKIGEVVKDMGQCVLSKRGEVWCDKEKNIFKIDLKQPVIDVQIGGQHGCATLKDKSLHCWRHHIKWAHSQPVQLFSKDDGVIQNTVSRDNSCVLTKDGFVRCWKNQAHMSQMRKSNYKNRVKIENGAPLTGITKLIHGSCALDEDGGVWCWRNAVEQPRLEGKPAVQITYPNSVCPVKNVIDIKIYASNYYAFIKGSKSSLERLEGGNKSTEIMEVIKSGDFKKANALIQKSACLITNTKLAEEALNVAIQRQEVEIVRELFNAGISPKMPKHPLHNALRIATNQHYTRNGINFDILKIIINAQNNNQISRKELRSALEDVKNRHNHSQEAVKLLESALKEKDIVGGHKVRQENVFDHYDEIPKILFKDIRARQTLKQYLEYTKKGFLKVSHKKNNISEFGLLELQAPKILEARKNQKYNILKNDHDLNGIVTEEEVLKTLTQKYSGVDENRRQAKINSRLQLAMKFDLNDDRVLTPNEIVILEPHKLNQIVKYGFKDYKEYLKLDTNADSSLTIDEFEGLALKSFSTLDLNADGILSHSESRPWIPVTPLTPRELEIQKFIESLTADKINRMSKEEVQKVRANFHKLMANQSLSEDLSYEANELGKKLSKRFKDTYRYREKDRTRNRMRAPRKVPANKNINNLINRSLSEAKDIKINQLISDIKLMSGSIKTFRNKYSSLPGDMKNAETRLRNCNENKCGSGNGNGRIADVVTPNLDLFKDERHLVWVHLLKAGFLNDRITDSNTKEWGKSFPSSPIGGGFHVMFYSGSKPLPYTSIQARPGHYLILTNDLNANLESDGAHLLTSHQAAQIDRMLDDGVAGSGDIIAAGNPACIRSGMYSGNAVTKTKKCLSLYIRIQ